MTFHNLLKSVLSAPRARISLCHLSTRANDTQTLSQCTSWAALTHKVDGRFAPHLDAQTCPLRGCEMPRVILALASESAESSSLALRLYLGESWPSDGPGGVPDTPSVSKAEGLAIAACQAAFSFAFPPPPLPLLLRLQPTPMPHLPLSYFVPPPQRTCSSSHLFVVRGTHALFTKVCAPLASKGLGFSGCVAPRRGSRCRVWWGSIAKAPSWMAFQVILKAITLMLEARHGVRLRRTVSPSTPIFPKRLWPASSGPDSVMGSMDRHCSHIWEKAQAARLCGVCVCVCGLWPFRLYSAPTGKLDTGVKRFCSHRRWTWAQDRFGISTSLQRKA